MHSPPGESEVYAPVAMWFEALDLVLQRLSEVVSLQRIRGVSGSCQQHGSVYWSGGAASKLAALTPEKSLVEQLEGALSHPYAPNWQDHSTGAECEQFNAKLGSAAKLAEVTGSGAHHVSRRTPFSPCCEKPRPIEDGERKYWSGLTTNSASPALKSCA